VLVVAVAFAVLNVAVTVHRSLIPVALDGVVQQVEVRREKNPGIDDVWLVHIQQRVLHTDAATAQQLPEGTVVAKKSWSRTLTADGRPLPLRLSRDAAGMLWVMPLAVAAAAALMAAGRRRPAASPKG
jgi:hypothetical protein